MGGAASRGRPRLAVGLLVTALAVAGTGTGCSIEPGPTSRANRSGPSSSSPASGDDVPASGRAVDATDETPGAPPASGVPPVPSAPATALVDRLVVDASDGADVGDYRRDEFGGGWNYDRSSGCNTRELVLITESHTDPVMGERCRPLSGSWVSIYDGVVTDDPADLEIDHMVPLAEAWRSGAARWTAERREAFANDLTDPATLVAVTSRSNRSKGDSSPDQWLPEAAGARCGYVVDWVRIKYRWGLSVGPAEKATLVQVLSGC